MGCRAKGNGHGSTLEFGKACHIAIDGDHNSISSTIWAVGQCADEDSFGVTRSFSSLDQINHRREVTHEADLNLTSHHLVGDRRSRGITRPFNIIRKVLVFSIFREILLENLQLSDNSAANGCINNLILSANMNVRTHRGIG